MNFKLDVTPNEIAEAFRALVSIENEGSTNSKSAILLQYESNKVLKALLYYTYDSFKQYYIKDLPKVESTQDTINAETYKEFLILLEKLANRELLDIKGHVKDFFLKCGQSELLWYSRVLERNLCIGIGANAINKVYHNYIPVYDVLLADRVKDVTLTDAKTIKALPERFVVQYKIDGYRLNVHKKNGKVHICSRNGLPIEGYSKLEQEAMAYLPDNYVYDGEMVSPKLFAWIEQNMLRDGGEKIADRSLFQEAVGKAFSKETNKEGIFNIFDVVDKDDWDSQNKTDNYEKRIAMLNDCIKPIVTSEDISQMAVVPTSRVFYKNNPDDLAEVVRIFHKFLSYGWEGLMIKSVDASYEWKRSKNLLKLKLMDTVDLSVVGVEEGKGQGAGAVGKLLCEYKGTVLNIGTGCMTAEEKEFYWKHKNDIIGKTIEVRYQAESVGKNGEPVLDFAQYRQLRNDK